MRAPVVEHFYIGDLAEIELSSPKQGNVSRRKNQGFFYKKKNQFPYSAYKETIFFNC